MVGFIGSIATQEGLESWYSTLEKPSFNPPDYIFAPVWTALYVMMGIAAGLVWHQGWQRKEVSNALMFFLTQLVLNGLWSTVFFGIQDLTAALVIIVLLWIMIGITTRKFFSIQSWAGILMLPYFLWVTFATVLNAAILSLNS